ncbi:MAG: 3-methyl-2-oxobutanoate hydroxymethyltransferase, partial [Endozoicomonadaceae bacterium]|nr:3-methyl-2-oxobutanoate hydroxymethyltransferase [Endozoicomonadaceae bacterium]
YLAMQITRTVGIPTIGIGAGADTDGQILVFYDMLNMTQGHLPRFTKNFLEGADSTQKAIFNYAYEVKAGIFPQDEHTYS